MEDYRLLKLKKYYKHTQDKTPFKKARALVVKDNNIICLAREMNNKTIKYYEIGGGVDDGETPIEAVIRECKEEANIVVKPIKLIHVSHERAKFVERGFNIDCKRVQYYYICKYVSGTPKIEKGNEFENIKVDVATIPLADINKLSFNKYFLKKAKQYLKLK